MKSHPQRRIALLKKGDTRIGSASFYNELIGTCNAFRTMRVKSGSKNDFVISDDNAELTISNAGGGTGSDGWHWMGEFDSALGYTIGSVVIVSPGNSAEGTVISAGKTTLAGMYVCVQGTSASTSAHYPCWPLPSATVSSALNFWMQISLYPVIIYACVGGVVGEYYVNAQPKL